jgi:hypothetical protein
VVDKGFAGGELMSPSKVKGMNGKRYTPLELGFKDFNPTHKDHVVFGEGGFYLRTTGSVARAAENQRRMATFVSSWKQGNTYDEAAHGVYRWVFDYDQLTDWMRRWVRPVRPFVNFTRNAIPAHVRGLKLHPSRYLAIAKSMELSDEIAEEKLGPIAVVNRYIDDQEDFRWPTQTPMGSDRFISVGLSWSELNILNPLLFQQMGSKAGFFDDVSPIVDLATLMVFGRDPKTGRMLSGEWQEPDVSLMKLVDFWNFTVGRHRALEVPKLPRVAPDGSTYYMLPAPMVWKYNKFAPNFISMSTTAFPLSGPFEKDKRQGNIFKQFTGVGVHLNNSIKAEIHELYRDIAAIEPSVVGVEDEPAAKTQQQE